MHVHAGTSNDPVTLKSVSNRSHVPRPAPANQIGRNRSQSVAGPKGETPGYDEVAPPTTTKIKRPRDCM